MGFGVFGEAPVFFTIFAIVVIGIVCAIIYSIATGASTAIKNSNSPLVSNRATIVDKRSKLLNTDHHVTEYYATFEFGDRTRLELKIPEQITGTITVGDQGVLSWQGTRFKGFAREIYR